MKLLPSVIITIIFSNVYHAKGNERDPPVGSTALPNSEKISLRIIGGQEITPHSHPFMVALVTPNNISAFCSGTLIKPSWVLTAAHCVYQHPQNLALILGAHDWTKFASDPKIVARESSQFIIHFNFNNDELKNDIALIKLDRPVNLNKNISTVTYADGTDSYAYDFGTMVGWGDTENKVSMVLREAVGRIMTNDECVAGDSFQKTIQSTNLCVSGSDIVGTCTADSGGPLLVNGVQVGIASFQYGSCREGKPSVFTRIADYQEWIAKYTSGTQSCGNIYCLLFLSVLSSLIHLLNSM